VIVLLEGRHNGALLMVDFLILNVCDCLSELLATQGEDAISTLPSEMGNCQPQTTIEMMSAASFDAFDEIRDRELGWD
jgi:hypothetical protein